MQVRKPVVAHDTKVSRIELTDLGREVKGKNHRVTIHAHRNPQQNRLSQVGFDPSNRVSYCGNHDDQGPCHQIKEDTGLNYHPVEVFSVPRWGG